MAINLIAGTVVVLLIVSIVMGVMEYEAWSAIGGITIWCKFFASFGLARQAHLSLGRPAVKATDTGGVAPSSGGSHRG